MILSRRFLLVCIPPGMISETFHEYSHYLRYNIENTTKIKNLLRSFII